MSWSVFDGTSSESHEDLFRFCRLKTPHGKAVLAGLEWADDPASYLDHALDAGLSISPGECVEILNYWDCNDSKRLLSVVNGTFNASQLLTLADVLDYEIVIPLIEKSLNENIPMTEEQSRMIAEYLEYWAEEDEEYTGENELTNTIVAMQEYALLAEAQIRSQEPKVGFLEGLLLGLASKISHQDNGSQITASEPKFKDFNNAWNNNNDHNWEADGDTKWDHHSGM